MLTWRERVHSVRHYIFDKYIFRVSSIVWPGKSLVSVCSDCLLKCEALWGWGVNGNPIFELTWFVQVLLRVLCQAAKEGNSLRPPGGYQGARFTVKVNWFAVTSWTLNLFLKYAPSKYNINWDDKHLRVVYTLLPDTEALFSRQTMRQNLIWKLLLFSI